MTRTRRRAQRDDPATQAFRAGLKMISDHPLFATLAQSARVVRDPTRGWAPDAWAVVDQSGRIVCHPTRRGDPEVWAYVLAHCLLHLGLGHFRHRPLDLAWNAACDLIVARFLADTRFGRPPESAAVPDTLPAGDETAIARQFRDRGVPPEYAAAGTAGAQTLDMLWHDRLRYDHRRWTEQFADGLRRAVTRAVDVAGGKVATLGAETTRPSDRTRARRWFIDSYPLLAALAAAFDVIEDPELCRQFDVTVAMVDMTAQEIFLNPGAGLTAAQWRFVIAHEMLHVGLRHDTRRQGRDPFFWNCACDFAINAWLIEMGIGDMPPSGLYDPALVGLSAEDIYMRICGDLRRLRKLATLRGTGLCDMVGSRNDGDDRTTAVPTDLDAFYRRCLDQGLSYHHAEGRGLLPAGLEEEIRTLAQPPIPWDVQLARWFETWVDPLERRRSFARPSRRQSAAPEIPLPGRLALDEARDGRTFAVVLDTSGSMDRALLGKALGAIASFAAARDVPAARVIHCDAAPFDAGYLPPDDLTRRATVRGRGGTALQPALDLLDRAPDFPRTGPVLIITDGATDRLTVRRPHAFLMPVGGRLPFTPKGPVFRMS